MVFLSFERLVSSWPGLSRPSTFFGAATKDVDARYKAGHDAFRGVEVDYAASTSTSSLSSNAVIVSFASSRIAAPSRALTRTPLTSTLPAAGTR